MKTSRIPIFDLEELRSEVVASEFRRCISGPGVFYLRHDKRLQIDHDLAAKATLDFFASCSEKDRRVVTNKDPTIRRGFSALGSESTARATGRGVFADYALGYSMGLNSNLFPSEAFAAAWHKYFESLSTIAHLTATLMLHQVSKEYGSNTLPTCDPVLRFRYFPEVPEDRCAEEEECRMAEHYDLSILTLIQQTPCANGFVSLQVRIGEALVDVPHIDGALVVMCGAVAPLLSAGVIKVPLHRVRAPPRALNVGSDRTSSVFFLRPATNFRFSTSLARKCGLEVDLPRGTATFGEWMAGNYAEMRTAAVNSNL